MAAAQIANLNEFHEALMDYMILRPEASLREIGAHFGYSVSWLSIVTNSDVFRAAYAARRAGIEARIAADIPAKLRAVASVALDKLAEKVEEMEDPVFLRDTADMVLHRLGYAPSKTGVTVTGLTHIQNNFVLTPQELRQHQERILDGVVTQTTTEALSAPNTTDT